VSAAGLAFSILAAVISAGGVLVAVGVFKGRINQNAETLKIQAGRIEELASKNEVGEAVRHVNSGIETSMKRADELLAIMRDRAEEDRSRGQSQYREFMATINGHEKRISSLETQQTATAKSLDEIKADLKDGFRDIQNELKELGKKT